MTATTNERGIVQGLRCHDGHLVSVRLLEGQGVELGFRRLDGSAVRMMLSGVRRFALDRFREGNIVDAAYLWPLDQAPAFQRRDAAKAFDLDEGRMLGAAEVGECLFVLESSYGAVVHAVVRDVGIIDTLG